MHSNLQALCVIEGGGGVVRACVCVCGCVKRKIARLFVHDNTMLYIIRSGVTNTVGHVYP
jgi:hypothetical protein